jgi:hypothetical protein
MWSSSVRVTPSEVGGGLAEMPKAQGWTTRETHVPRAGLPFVPMMRTRPVTAGVDADVVKVSLADVPPPGDRLGLETRSRALRQLRRGECDGAGGQRLVAGF